VPIPVQNISPPLLSVTESLPLVIKVIREAHGFSQRDLAKIMIVPRTYISKIENNHATPNLSSLEHIAQALDASPFALIAMSERALTAHE
jgi:transcriptional regulator with XRE-family HTH domain